jgi:hypothetical protein
MLFPIVLLASVAAETNRYGKWLEQIAISQGRRPKVWVDTDVDELCRFFGLIIVRTLHTTSFFMHIFFRAKTFVCDCSHIAHISGDVHVQTEQSKNVLRNEHRTRPALRSVLAVEPRLSNLAGV